MRNVENIRPQSDEQGFQFPGEFEIKAMGHANAELDKHVPAILEDIGLGVVEGSLTLRASSGGVYVSVGVCFSCPSREKYNEAHAALRAHPAIHYTL